MQPLPRQDPPAPGRIFLTGATGVLGAYILKALLESTRTRIVCLARAGEGADARARVESFLKTYDPGELLREEFAARVEVLSGDITAPDLGLGAESSRRLADEINLVIHAAASTELLTRLGTIEPINVGGTRNVIEFALRTPRKRLAYVSSYSVMGDKAFDPAFTFTEDHYDVGQAFKGYPYQQTKFMAEGLVRESGDRGLLWDVFRPGQIYGDSRTGAYPLSQTKVGGLFYDILKTVIETGISPVSGFRYDITPVDYAARALVTLALKDGPPLNTYHLTNPDERTFAEMIGLLQELGYPIAAVPVADYRELLLSKRITVSGRPYRSAMTKAFTFWFRTGLFNFNDNARVSCSRTLKSLEPSGITCAPIDARLLRTYVDAGAKMGYFARPEPSSV